jgi:hypothetical protein
MPPYATAKPQCLFRRLHSAFQIAFLSKNGCEIRAVPVRPVSSQNSIVPILHKSCGNTAQL